jgi:hypothetical protein
VGIGSEEWGMENGEWRMICLIIKSERKGKTN